jgi:hypothetical protein
VLKFVLAVIEALQVGMAPRRWKREPTIQPAQSRIADQCPKIRRGPGLLESLPRFTRDRGTRPGSHPGAPQGALLERFDRLSRWTGSKRMPDLAERATTAPLRLLMAISPLVGTYRSGFA